MDMNLHAKQRFQLWRMGLGSSTALQMLCLCILLTGQLSDPMLAQSDQSSITPAQPLAVQGKVAESKPPAKPQKELPPTEVTTQESRPVQPKTQAAKNEESKTKKDNGEEGTEKESAGRNAGSSLILTVKLALMEDPRLFPYEVEVEAGSDEVTLVGKVSSEAEKSAAGKIASTVPTVKSVSNKLEVVKELSEIIAHRQDDVITRLVKERFAKSATVTSANFDVKTEQGVVALSGTVRFQVIVLEAVEAVRQVPGVRAVKTDKVRIEREG
ncbi:MAG TPA: BON domain-containing protein [Nitrospiraceae bacterium]|nr:BON domain-containing protein [Nitrospiraceae bacterium]